MEKIKLQLGARSIAKVEADSKKKMAFPPYLKNQS
jgi:hypothetical protein